MVLQLVSKISMILQSILKIFMVLQSINPNELWKFITREMDLIKSFKTQCIR